MAIHVCCGRGCGWVRKSVQRYLSTPFRPISIEEWRAGGCSVYLRNNPSRHTLLWSWFIFANVRTEAKRLTRFVQFPFRTQRLCWFHGVGDQRVMSIFKRIRATKKKTFQGCAALQGLACQISQSPPLYCAAKLR